MLKQFMSIAVFIASINFAASANSMEEKYTPLKTKLETKFPHVKINDIIESPIKGFLEVSAGADIFYITENGEYMMDGNVISLQHENAVIDLTEAKRKQARLRLIKTINPKDLIVFAPPKPKAHVTIFSDIDCSYCRKLHNEMAAINKLGIEVRYLIFPRTGPKTPSFTKAVSVWCAKNRNLAFTNAMQGKEVATATCSNSVDAQFDLGLKMHISGTPTMVFADGSILSSYLPPEKLANIAIERANFK